MSNCPICDTKLTIANKPMFKTGLLANGETICHPCKVRTINNGIEGKLTQYTPNDLIEMFSSENERIDIINKQIENSKTPNATNWLGKKEVKELPNIIQSNEVIKCLIQGIYNKGNGLLVLTDKRLIFIDKGFVNLKTEDFPLKRISSIQFESGILYAKIKIHTSSNIAEIENVDKVQGKEFVNFVKSQIEESENNGNKSKVIQQQPDILLQIEKLSELKDKGILTEDEFNDKKAKLLEQL